MTDDGYEERDGRKFKVTRLPDVPPPKGRQWKKRYKLSDVGKGGDVPGWSKKKKGRPK